MKKFLRGLLIFILIILVGLGIGIFIGNKVIYSIDKGEEKTKEVYNNQISNEIGKNNEEQEESIKIATEDPMLNLKFELPINGTTGYAPVEVELYNSFDKSSKVITKMARGDAFTILEEKGDWWRVEYKDKEGWVVSKICMINLPDIIPSIIYDDTNSYKSIFTSSGYNLDGVTDNQLYNAKSKNERLDKEEFNMPLIYQMAKKIYSSQKMALANGESLKIYETYRPYEVQMKVVSTLKKLMDTNKEVYKRYTHKWMGRRRLYSTIKIKPSIRSCIRR